MATPTLLTRASSSSQQSIASSSGESSASDTSDSEDSEDDEEIQAEPSGGLGSSQAPVAEVRSSRASPVSSRKGKERLVESVDDGQGADTSEEETDDASSDEDEDEDEDEDTEQLTGLTGLSQLPKLREARDAQVRTVKDVGDTDDPGSSGLVTEALEASSEDDEEEDEDEDDEDGEEEPSLKYSRLGSGAQEILVKDTTSAIAVSSRLIALGTHNGMVHVLTYEGSKVNSFRPHAASVTDIQLDDDNDFVATTSMEGRVVIHSLTTPESYAFDFKRPMRAVALEPGFGKKSSRSFVCGGLAGNLVLHEKGWLGYKEQVIHSGEGPIWAIEWRGNLIAWANDMGVKIYNTSSSQRIGFIDRPADSPRADLFKCNLLWRDDQTLVIAWADHIKVARVRTRSRSQSGAGLPSLTVDITAIFQVDCMISGIAAYKDSYLVLAYIAPDTFNNEATEDPVEQRRKAANRPELRIINKGEEISSDALSLTNFHLYGCNDYVLAPSGREGDELYFVVSPKDVVVARPRDSADHVNWLVDQQRYAEALEAAEKLKDEHGHVLDVKAIGIKYIKHLFDNSAYVGAAALMPKVLGQDSKSWEDWIFLYVQKGQLQSIIPIIPRKHPQLSGLVYEMVLAHLLINDRKSLLETIKSWPNDIYDIRTVIVAVQGELESVKNEPILMECLAELYLLDRQPGKALPYFLRLRKPNVFDLIRDHNLFTAVRDQALLLVEFDQEVKADVKKDQTQDGVARHGAAIQLLVDHCHSIPIARVVQQLEARPKFLYMYLDALFAKDPHLAADYSDRQVELCAEYDQPHFLDYLRASNSYSLEKAYRICKERDLVPEMVFLLGRMGNNKQALMLIIERLGDVQRAIEFAKEQADEDLWEDLMRYSETKPTFIRGLLENVGAEISPIRLIRRIRDGLEIPGLKGAVIKILQASNLQISLLEGCQTILHSDCNSLATELQQGQTAGAYGTVGQKCEVCGDSVFRPSFTSTHEPRSKLALVYLCRHVVHASCALPSADIDLPLRPESASVSYLLSAEGRRSIAAQDRALGSKLAFAAMVRVRVGSCPVCSHRGGHGARQLSIMQ